MKGNITVHTQNIFPIIKKWLYSEKDIFLRELVANACDAVTKHKKLKDAGVVGTADDAYEIHVIVDKENKTLTISDNGIGMTAQEVEKYITQVAFSGAEEFLNKYESKDQAAQIIGHFGLGFYSAFMVADTVEINTLSFAEGAEAAHWVCDGGTEYEMTKTKKDGRGTEVVLHILEDEDEYLSITRIREVLDKYCAFLPEYIYCYQRGEDKGVPVNEVLPLWMKKPSECDAQDYKAFYQKVFRRPDEPLFWIHLNTDFPFRLKGLLYFPRLDKQNAMMNQGQVKLYNNQVFVADNIKEIIPEFLLLLKGVIDCPDMPLNVSRSFLQNDGTVRKISDHIVKKVADRLAIMAENEKEDYKSFWSDISGFVKFGCMSDVKFYDKVKSAVIFETSDERFVTLDEFVADGDKKEVYYATSKEHQLHYLNLFKEQGIEVLILPDLIDSTFVQFLEYKNQDILFKCIDSVTPDSFKTDETGADEEKISAIFKSALTDITIVAQSLKNKEIPAMIQANEYERRMKAMSVMMGGIEIPQTKTLLVNLNHELIKNMEALSDEDATLVAQQVYDLARIADEPMTADEMNRFINRSTKVLELFTNK